MKGTVKLMDILGDMKSVAPLSAGVNVVGTEGIERDKFDFIWS